MVVYVRLGLTFRSFSQMRQKLLPGQAEPDAFDPVIVRRSVRSVDLVSRFVPYASCLTQALSCQVLLARRRIPSQIHVGVRADETGAFRAHAWLVCRDRVVLGGNEHAVGRFSQITQFGPSL